MKAITSRIPVALIVVLLFSLLGPLGAFWHVKASPVTDLVFDFEDGTTMGWSKGWGSFAEGDAVVTAAQDLTGDSYALKADVHYTISGDNFQGAALTYTAGEDLGVYESISYDVYVPVTFPGTFALDTALNGGWQSLKFSNHVIPGSQTTLFNGQEYAVIAESVSIPADAAQRQLVIQLSRNSDLDFNGSIYVDNIRLTARTTVDLPSDDALIYDFEDGTTNGWQKGWGEGFEGDDPVTASQDLSVEGNSYALRVDTSYSGSGWEEAALRVFTTDALGAYESVHFEVFVPASFAGTLELAAAMNGSWQDLTSSSHDIINAEKVVINGNEYAVISQTAAIPEDSTQQELVVKLAKNSDVTYTGPIYLDNVRLIKRTSVEPPPSDPSSVITVTYQDAVLTGYGIEKRGSVAEGDDTLYDGDGYISYFFGEDDAAEEPIGSASFTVNVADGGLYKLSIGYYLPEGYGSKATNIEVNGAGAGEMALDAPAAGTVRAEKMVSKIMLNAGSNVIGVKRGWGYYGIEYIKVESASAPPVGSKLEAEDGTMTSGVSIGTEGSGYSGTGYAAFQQSGSLTLSYNAATAGLYDVVIGYSSPNGEKKTSMVINGQTSEITLSETTAFIEVSAGKAMLNQGDNTIQFLPNWGWYNIDYVKLTAAAGSSAHDVVSTLVNPNATQAARALMNYLANQYGHGIIAGQQTLEDAEWIEQQTGKYPAILASDLMDYSPSRVERGTTSTEVEKLIDWYELGGIVALCWHWNAPKGIGGDEPGREWWRGFYTEFTTFDVKYALDHPDSEDYALLIRDIDAIAAQLKRLQNAGVPVLWRPLHEAEGGWFWWGAQGPEPTKQLWHLMYDRLTNHHGLNNLIWVWNSEKTEWYPGDDVVDIASVDIYNPAGDYNPSIAKYDNLRTLVNDSKIIGLAENGPIPDPDQLQAYGADWSFFATWTGDFIRDGLTNSSTHLNKVYNHDYVITRDELPSDLYTSYKYEAEQGELTGLTVAAVSDGYSGSGYVTGMDEAGDKLQVSADIAAGNYKVTIRYQSGTGDKTNDLSINGQKVAEHVFSETSEWTDVVLGPYALTKGLNTIDISNNWGWIDIDYVKLTSVPAPPATPSSPSNNAGSQSVSNGDVVTVEVDGSALTEALDKLSDEGEAARYEIKIDRSAPAVKVNIPAAVLARAASKHPNAIIVIQSDNASYNLPISVVKVEDIAAQLGVAASDIRISVKMDRLAGQQAEDIRAQLDTLGVLAVGDLYDFSITAETDNGAVAIHDFGNAYVSRTITIDQALEGNFTAIVIEPEKGSIAFVPALFDVVDGKTVVTIKRNGNSIYSVVKLDRTFSDLAGHWARADIETLANKLIVDGIANSRFAPNQSITRAEFAAFLVRALSLTPKTETTSYSDVPADKWYRDAIGAASQAGLITGYADGSFRPEAPITREQMAVMIMRAARFAGHQTEASTDILTKYDDGEQVSAWAAESMKAALSAGLVQGLTENHLGPSESADRAQAAVMIKRLLVYLNFINA